jgi:ABC-type Fe3+-hydroxamate transport system substrate-binding protein
MDDFGAARLQNAAHHVDRRVVAVEEARRGDEANPCASPCRGVAWFFWGRSNQSYRRKLTPVILPTQNDAPHALVDAIGTRHHAVTAPPRIVSLVPSITELLCDLGLAASLVGRTGFCIHPRALVRGIPKVGGTKTVDVARIRELAPTHLVVNIDENEKPTVDELARLVPHVIVTHPLAPRDNLALYRLLGGIFDRAGEAETLCAEFERAYAERWPHARACRAATCCTLYGASRG